MSFILDALRRAEAERERERHAVPGLTSPIWLPPESQAPRAARRSRWLAYGVALLAAMAIAAALWWWLGRDRSDAMPAVAAAPPAAAAPAAPPMATAPAAAIASVPAPRPPPVVHAARPGPPPPVAAPAPAPTPAPPMAVVPSAPAPPPAVPAAAPAPSRPLTLAELPEPQRTAVGKLAVGGAVHSQDRRQSFVMIGGQIVREGESLGSGITLDRIQPRSLLLRVGEQLVELGF